MRIKILAMHEGKIRGFINAYTEYPEDGRNALQFCLEHLEKGEILLAIDEYSDVERISINMRRSLPFRPAIEYCPSE